MWTTMIALNYLILAYLYDSFLYNNGSGFETFISDPDPTESYGALRIRIRNTLLHRFKFCAMSI